MKTTPEQLAQLKAPKDADTPGAASIEFDNWYDSKFKPAMERGPFDKYVARQAWFAAREAIPALLADLEEASAEITRLRQGLWDCFAAAGGDTDGDRTPVALVSDIVPLALECVKELRAELEEATAARGNSVRRLLRSWRKCRQNLFSGEV